jgi:hypothetical protein
MKYVVLFIFSIISFFSFSFGASSNWSGEPVNILNNVQNIWWKDSVQETALDDVNSSNWVYWEDMKISNTLDSIKSSIWPYINWIVFIWLSIASILLIYNWIILALWVVQQSQVWKVKTRIMYILSWVIVTSWFYFIMKLIVSILGSIL